MSPEDQPQMPEPEVTPPTDSTPTQSPQVPPQVTNPVPMQQPSVVGGVSPMTGMALKKRRMLPFVVAGVAVVAVAGVAYAFHTLNSPSNVYSMGMRNTGKALDKLISYTKEQQKANYVSTTFDGTLKIKSASGSYDFSLNGAADKRSDATLDLEADVVGEKVHGAFRSVHVAGNDTPDIYLQVTGAKNLLTQFGLGSLDGQWIVADHTLLDTYASSLRQRVTSVGNASKMPTYAQTIDAIDKMQAVNKQYIFSTDKSRAVITNKQFVGKETVHGRSMNHYKAGYDKAHLQAYISALQTALNNSKLNDWSRQASASGKNIGDAVDVSSLKQKIASADANYTFDVWVDTGTRLVGQLRFAAPHDQSTFTLTQLYTGGDTYPFSIAMSGKDSGGDPEATVLGLSFNTKTNKAAVTFSDRVSGKEATRKVDGSFTVTPSTNKLTVTAPKGAKSILEVLTSLGFSPTNSKRLPL